MNCFSDNKDNIPINKTLHIYFEIDFAAIKAPVQAF